MISNKLVKIKGAQKPTLTIGIPAHNEEQNIGELLTAIMGQQGDFSLERVLVLCDGCTDQTEQVAKRVAQKFPIIEVKNDGKRLGKASRLNQIYAATTTELLLTFDADVMPERKSEIQRLIKVMKQNPQTVVVGGRMKPVLAETFFGKLAYVSYLSFEDAFMQMNGGNNYYSLMGGASLIRTDFAKKNEYPREVISDMNFLYTLATQHHAQGVRLAVQTKFLFRTVETFHDWRVLAIRAVLGDKHNLTEFFGEEVLATYTISKALYLKSLMKWLYIHPLWTMGAIVMNVFIRLFPLKKVTPKNGIWEDTRSSKGAISNHA